MKLHINSVRHHRTGPSGAPFHAVHFRDPDEGDMLGIVFEASGHVAVLRLVGTATGPVAVGVDSSPAGDYETRLRAAVGRSGTSHPPLDVHTLLAGRNQVAVIWDVVDVQSIRPDLDDDMAWRVIEHAVRHHDSGIGLNWEVIHEVAEELFPESMDDSTGEDRP